MRIELFSIFYLIFIVVGYPQQEQLKIEWREGVLLSWGDFQAEPDSSLSYSANTNSGITYSWNYSTSSGKPVLKHEVHAFFYPEKSWVKKEDADEYLLAHEQLHFDISELYARKLRQALNSYEIGRTIRQDLKRIYNQIEKERAALQDQFDKETMHSENREAEMRWRSFVAKELDKLAAFQ
ncbi:DUF922 domain-containing protein [Gramella lutea]|uniref:DUF922 domain-containing protein n=1 Tax=Christiangramia lutea TaxID=1607951 RepID=A0A9X1V3W4_9FLAO|nr:DUF922 domain-containing protein [Christiangramia lutea]MCH4823606.1 DUF922 domain-containing protein [Christiangramia lutea]